MLYGLEQIQPDKTRFGTKAVNLHLLLRSGLPVPPGFCLGTEFFREFCAFNHLRTGPAEALCKGDYLRRRILEGRFSPAQSKQLAFLCESLQGLSSGSAELIARSSSPLEDGDEHAAAGAFVSRAGIYDPAGLEQGVRECYGSLCSDQALSYLADAHDILPPLEMAVLVQLVVQGEASGVAFTCDPKTGNKDHVWVNWVPGPCRGLVDGSVAGSFAVFDTKGVVVSAREAGAAPQVFPASRAGACVQTFRQIATILECPQDIEWTHDGKGLWILQSRPVTKLRRPARDVPDCLKDPEMNWELEPWRRALKPLEAEAWIATIKGHTRFGNEHGWSDLCAEAFVYRGYCYRRRVPPQGGPVENMADLANSFIRKGKNLYHNHALPIIQASQKNMEDSIKTGYRERGPDLMSRALDYVELNTCMHWVAVWGLAYVEPWDPAVRDICKDVPELRSQLGPDQIFDLLYMPSINTELRQLWIRAALLVRASADLLELCARIPSNRLLWHRLGSTPEGRRVLAILGRLRRRGGMVQYEHAWEDQCVLPALVEPWAGLDTLRNLACSGGDLPAAKPLDWKRRQGRLEKRFLETLPPQRRSPVRQCLRRGRLAFVTRDDHSFWFDSARMGVFMRVAHHAGRVLAKRGILPDWRDVFYLSSQEVDGLLGGTQILQADTLARRRGEHRSNCSIVPPCFSRSAGPGAETPGEQTPAASGRAEPAGPAVPGPLRGRQLEGLCTMPGRIDGVAWIHGKQRPESGGPVILVVEEERACELLGLLPLIRGVVIDKGSPFSHMAITAREYGIPVMYQTLTACGELANGQAVVLDCDSGLLRY